MRRKDARVTESTRAARSLAKPSRHATRPRDFEPQTAMESRARRRSGQRFVAAAPSARLIVNLPQLFVDLAKTLRERTDEATHPGTEA